MKSKKQQQIDKAFIAKIATIGINTGAGSDSNSAFFPHVPGKCDLCGDVHDNPGKIFGPFKIRLPRPRPPADEQAFSE